MDVGENLAWNSQEPIDCRIPLQLWYDEWKTYNFRNPHINPRNGHFSQMVSKLKFFFQEFRIILLFIILSFFIKIKFFFFLANSNNQKGLEKFKTNRLWSSN